VLKSLRLIVLSVLALSLVSASTLAQVTNSTKNPMQVATLHWYKANLTTAFGVGTRPLGVAFDGANIWVTNTGSNTVTKLRASDGTVLGTFGVGTNPSGLAFDGANIWVANHDSNTVSKL
jgi:YVTN family beta-propeller protein